MEKFLALAALISSAPSTAEAPLAPTGKWVVNFADAQCVAQRSYGDRLLVLKAPPLGDVVQFALSKAGKYQRPYEVEAEITPASGPAFKGFGLTWSAGKPPTELRMINLPIKEFDRLQKSPTLRIMMGDEEVPLTLSGMDQVSRVLKTCVDDLQQVWGGDGPGTPARSKSSLASYVNNGDFPD